jgi:hypothetical protein
MDRKIERFLGALEDVCPPNVLVQKRIINIGYRNCVTMLYNSLTNQVFLPMPEAAADDYKRDATNKQHYK